MQDIICIYTHVHVRLHLHVHILRSVHISHRPCGMTLGGALRGGSECRASRRELSRLRRVADEQYLGPRFRLLFWECLGLWFRVSAFEGFGCGAWNSEFHVLGVGGTRIGSWHFPGRLPARPWGCFSCAFIIEYWV